MKKLILKLEDLKDAVFAEGVEGVGTCGFAWDDEGYFTGYLYASHGYGSMESYWTIRGVINNYPELASLLVEVEINECGEITSLRS